MYSPEERTASRHQVVGEAFHSRQYRQTPSTQHVHTHATNFFSTKQMNYTFKSPSTAVEVRWILLVVKRAASQQKKATPRQQYFHGRADDYPQH